MDSLITPTTSERTAFDTIITTPFVERTKALLVDCEAAQAIGILAGPNGAGKTFALRALQKRYSQTHSSTCVYYRCCQARGFTRGIRDVLTHLGVGGAIVRNFSNASLQLLIKVAVREFASLNIGCVLLDEIELWNAEALGGLISLYDVCRDNGNGFTLVLAGAKPPALWTAGVAALVSRTLKIEEADLLDVKNTAGVLRNWHPAFERLCHRYDANEKSAVTTLKIVHKATRGNLRKLAFFGRLFVASNKTDITVPDVRALLKRMTLQPIQ